MDLVPRSPLNSVQMPAKAVSGGSPFRANQTMSFFLVSGFGSGAYSAKLFAGTKQNDSHAPHARWNDWVGGIMQLTQFKVTKYRNVVDSGWIDVNSNITAFVGHRGWRSWHIGG